MSGRIKSGLLAALLNAKIQAYIIGSHNPDVQAKLNAVRDYLEKAIEIVEEITEKVEGEE